MKSAVSHITKTACLFLDWIFPFLCVACKKELRRKEVDCPVCKECEAGVEILRGAFCSVCRSRVPFGTKAKCHENGFSLFAVTSYKNSVVKSCITSLKYQGMRQLMRFFERLLFQYLSMPALEASFKNKKVILVPIPLYYMRENERGFNQSELIALIAVKILIKTGIDASISKKILKKSRGTETQAALKTRQERISNTKNCFRVEEAEIRKDCVYVIIDDIYTSGATMNEARRALCRAGVKRIISMVIAVA